MLKGLEELLRDYLTARELKLAVAESCSGGLLSHRITNISGSSEYFPGGVVSYSNDAKARLLGVSWDALNKYGAVSQQVVLEMAGGVRNLFETEIGLSVSGIAGPTGRTAEKPVGTTWVGLSTAEREWARQFLWHGDREQNKADSAEAALQFVIDYLDGKLA